MSEAHGGVRGDGIPVCHLPPTVQIAQLDQAAPVQNTWYTVLDARNVRVYFITVTVLTVGETLEARITIDGTLYTAGGGTAVAAGANHKAYLSTATFGGPGAPTGYAWITAPGSDLNAAAQTFLEGKHILIEIRKITVAGAGNLQACALYGTWP